MELVGMRAQPDGIDLLVPLVAEPGFNDVLGEDIAANSIFDTKGREFGDLAAAHRRDAADSQDGIVR